VDFKLGKSYDQLRIGEEASFTKTITETDVYLFAGISGDFNPMHVNEAFARQTPFKTRIAHGGLPQSLIAPVLGMKLPGLGTIAVEISCRFKAPVFFGDTITAAARVVEKIEKKQWVRMALSWTNQHGTAIAEGEAVVMPPSKTPRLRDEGDTSMDAFNPREKEDKKMALTSVKEVFDKMPAVFNANAAQGLDAIFQYEITGENGGSWNVVVKDGACQVNEGVHASPSVTLTMSGDTWLGIVNKQTNGMQAFMTGKLKASGNIMLAQRIEQLFPL
jgi:3-hydroxybutyryl-CoA dehydratase